MKVDPRITFWLSLITTLAKGVTSGAVHLAGIVPAESIPTVTAWLGLIVFVNMSVITAMSGMSGPGVGPLASKPTQADVQKVAEQAK